MVQVPRRGCCLFTQARFLGRKEQGLTQVTLEKGLPTARGLAAPLVSWLVGFSVSALFLLATHPFACHLYTAFSFSPTRPPSSSKCSSPLKNVGVRGTECNALENLHITFDSPQT